MSFVQRTVRGAAIIGLFAVGACQSGAGGGLGSILGSVLGGQQQGQAQQIDATVRGVDTRSQQLTLQQTNGQNVAVLFDNNTQVVYQNRNYAVSSLENGDRITARLQQNQNGGYYVDLITVTQPVNGSAGTVNNGNTGNNVQTLQGTVRQVDRNNGLFTVETSPNVVLTVSMPYNPARNDSDRFQSLRNGDFVRFYGTYLNSSRVQLTQFY
jgi:Cu/Ag efflux protein CusF